MPATAKLPPGEGKRVPLNMRTTRELRSYLERGAAASGRSLAQEVEHRLWQSKEGDEAFGGRQFRTLFGLFGNAAILIEQQTGKSCFKDWNTWVATLAAWKRLGVAFGPLAPKGWREALLEASKATSITALKSRPKDADLRVQEAYLLEASKAIHAISVFYRYQEDDRAQEVFGEEIAAAVLVKKPEKGS